MITSCGESEPGELYDKENPSSVQLSKQQSQELACYNPINLINYSGNQ